MNVSHIAHNRRGRVLAGVAAVALMGSFAGITYGQDGGSGIRPGCEAWGTPIPEDICTPVITDPPGSPAPTMQPTNTGPTPIYPTATGSPQASPTEVVDLEDGTIVDELPGTGSGSAAVFVANAGAAARIGVSVDDFDKAFRNGALAYIRAGFDPRHS